MFKKSFKFNIHEIMYIKLIKKSSIVILLLS